MIVTEILTTIFMIIVSLALLSPILYVILMMIDANMIDRWVKKYKYRKISEEDIKLAKRIVNDRNIAECIEQEQRRLRNSLQRKPRFRTVVTSVKLTQEFTKNEYLALQRESEIYDWEVIYFPETQYIKIKIPIYN